jgi:hypothetical protein
MRDRDNRTLREVHQSEPNPYTDRQNLEPEPAETDADDELAQLDRESDSLDADAGYDDGNVDLGEADPDYDTQAANNKSRSDIGEYARQDTSDAPADDEAPRNHDDNRPLGRRGPRHAPYQEVRRYGRP